MPNARLSLLLMDALRISTSLHVQMAQEEERVKQKSAAPSPAVKGAVQPPAWADNSKELQQLQAANDTLRAELAAAAQQHASSAPEIEALRTQVVQASVENDS
jgi:hypothetical protein